VEARGSVIIKRASVTALDFDGLRILDYTAGLDTRSSLAQICVPPGERHALSWSTRSDKYYYVLCGALIFWLEGEQTTLQAGDLCLVPQGWRFRYENSLEVPVELILFHTPSFQLEAEVFED
jgi:mannose-6-phosphate isomerase-like protein (cupin superfamily)